MRLEPRLSHTTLGDILGSLFRSRVSGSLELCGKARTYGITLREGVIISVHNEAASSPIGEVLRERAALTEEQQAALAAIQSAGDPRFAGDIALGLGWVPADELQRALRLQMKERLEPLYSLPDARLSFHAFARRRRPHAEVRLDPSEFLYGRRRHRSTTRRQPPRDAATMSAPDITTLLGLDATAPVAVVRRAFRTRAAALHPDRLPPELRRSSARLLAQLTEAYHRYLASAAS